MRIAILTASTNNIYKLFLSRHETKLRENGIEVALVVVDENRSKGASPLSHAMKIAARQARAAGCSIMMGFLKILFYKMVMRLGKGHDPAGEAENVSSAKTIRVGTLNSPEAIDAITRSGCDVVCLMGTRILTRKTLERISRPTLNIHSSDPRFMRGSPSVVWEILAGLDVITLTIHEVVEALDSGRICLQASHPIEFTGGLAATTQATLSSATVRVVDLFFDTIQGLRDGSLRPTEFTPGPLRVTPGILQTLRAELICRTKHRKHATVSPS